MPAKAFGYDEDMWGGNYRFYYWYNGLDHAKLVWQGEGSTDNNKERNYGFGLSFDQAITDVFGVFARYGWERHDISIASTNANSAPLESAWSCGMQMTGKYWKRNDDILAFAIGQAIPSEQYKDAGLGFISPEGHFETYYKIQITKNIALSPDIQVVWNPHGVSESYQGSSNPIFVYGMRGQLDF
jgi:carbohydrate-selective porin OprB